MNPDPTIPFRVDLDAAIRRSWMESGEVTPAPRGRWCRWDLITGRREREAARLDHAHPFWTQGSRNRVEFWEDEDGDLRCMTFHPYYIGDEEEARAEWAEALRLLKDRHGLTVRVHTAALSWRYPGKSLLVEVWAA